MFGTRRMLTNMIRHVVAMTTTKWNQVEPNQEPSHFAWISETTLFYNQVEPSGTESGTELLAWISGQNHLQPDSYYNTN